MNYSESFTPSGLLQPGTGQIVPPAQGTGKEIGIKTAWFGGEVAEHDLGIPRRPGEHRDAGLFHPGPDRQHCFLSSRRQGPNSEGGEAEIVWTPSSSLQLSANYTYMPTAEYLRVSRRASAGGAAISLHTQGAVESDAALCVRRTACLSGAYVGGWIHGQSVHQEVCSAATGSTASVFRAWCKPTLFFGYTFFEKLDARVNVKNIGNRGGYVMNNALSAQLHRDRSTLR